MVDKAIKKEVKQPSIEDNPKIKAWIAKNPAGKDEEIEKLALMLADKKVSRV